MKTAGLFCFKELSPPTVGRCVFSIARELSRRANTATDGQTTRGGPLSSTPWRTQFTCYDRLRCVFVRADNCNAGRISKPHTPGLTGLHVLDIFVSISSAIFVYSSLLAAYVAVVCRHAAPSRLVGELGDGGFKWDNKYTLW